jgi:hypothetical protein
LMVVVGCDINRRRGIPVESVYVELTPKLLRVSQM